MICLRIGKTSEAKPHRVNLRSLLARIHYFHNKRLQVNESHYLNPYPNTQLDLFCNDNISFSMHGSQYVTNQSMYGSKYVINTPTWKGCWLQSSSVHPHDEEHKTPWLQNLTAYKRNIFFKRKMNYGICIR